MFQPVYIDDFIRVPAGPLQPKVVLKDIEKQHM